MARFLYKHRRGTASDWINKGNEIIPLEGEIVIELDEESNAHKLKIGDGVHVYSELKYLQAGDDIVTQVLAKALPHVVTVELTTNWTMVTEGEYSQVVALDNITEHSRLDLQPSADMLAEFKQLGLVFVTENNGGTITVYSVGNMPPQAYTMQATIVETECSGLDDPIIGMPVGVPALGALASKDEVAKADLAADVQASLNKADTAIQSIDGLATEDYVDNKVDSLGGLASKSTVEKTDLSTDIQASLNKADSALQSFTETDPTVPAWAKADTKPSYTASEVGAVPTSRTVNGKALSADITLSASDVGALPNTTSIPDSLSDLSSDASHRTVTDTEKATWNAKATTTYVDQKVAGIVDSSPEALDTLNELAAALGDDPNFATTVAEEIGKKADKAEIPTKTSQLTNDSDFVTSGGTVAKATTADQLGGVAASSYAKKTDIPPAITVDSALSSTSTNPVQNKVINSALAGKAAASDLTSHTGNTTSHITSTERSNWNAAKTHADSAHAPSNAEKNQNAFSNITVGSTTVAADSATDTVTFVGSNVTITPDATNDKITFAVADGSTSAKGIVQLTNSTSSTSTTTAATPSSVKSAYDLANTAKTAAATAQTKADSAYTLAESKAVIKELTSEDLDDVVKEGFYNAGGSNTVTNKPSGIDHFGLYVIHRASGAYYTQILIGNNTKSYRRHCDNGIWGSWSEDKLTDTTYTLSSFGVTATATELNYVDGVTSNIQTQLNNRITNEMGYVNKSIVWNASSYIQNVILLIPVLQSNNWCGYNYIDGRFFLWKTGGNVYDTIEINANCVYNQLRYHLECFGDHPSAELCVCKYNGVLYYAIKCPYHANPYTNATFVGRIRSDISGGTSTVNLPLSVSYYDEDTKTVLNAEVNNSITTTLTTTYVTSASGSPLYSKDGFAGDLTGTATKAIKDGNGNTITSTYLPLSGGTITATSGDAPLRIKSTTNASYIGFLNSSNTTLGYFGVDSNKQPVFYDTTNRPIIHSGNIGSQSVNYANSAGAVAWGNVSDKPGTFPPSGHTHTKSQITDFPTSLPASDVYSWAKASTKPSYAWSEITSKPSTFTPASHEHTTHSQASMSNIDLNTIKTAGWYYGYTGMTNAPVQTIAVMEVLVYSPDWIIQRFIVVNGAEYIRHWHSATTWSAWKTNVDSGNIDASISAGSTSTNLPTSKAVAAFVEGKGYTTNTGDITAVVAGNGLTGGATSGSATLNVGAGTGITVNADTIEVKYGTSAGTACQGNDSRLSDARTPTSHAHGNITNSGTITSTAVSSATGVLVYDSNNKIQRATAANARSIIGAGTSNLTIGTTSTTAAAGNHTHSGYAASSHTHTLANVGITYGTTDLTAGSSALTTGTLYFVYE